MVLLAAVGVDNGSNRDGIVCIGGVQDKDLLNGGLVYDVGEG